MSFNFNHVYSRALSQEIKQKKEFSLDDRTSFVICFDRWWIQDRCTQICLSYKESHEVIYYHQENLDEEIFWRQTIHQNLVVFLSSLITLAVETLFIVSHGIYPCWDAHQPIQSFIKVLIFYDMHMHLYFHLTKNSNSQSTAIFVCTRIKL